MSEAMEQKPPKVHKPFALHQLIPDRQLKFPGSHKLLGRQERDDVILKGIRGAVRGGNPTVGEGHRLFADLIDLAERCLPLRSIQRHDRANYWRVLAERWEESSGVCLLAVDVRDILLAILRAERLFTGQKTDSWWFPTKVRAINDYLRVNEGSSDEAAELLIEVRTPKINVFQPIPDVRVPWSSMTFQQTVASYFAALHQPPVTDGDVMDVDQPSVQPHRAAIDYTTLKVVDEETHFESQAQSDPGYNGDVPQASDVAKQQLRQHSQLIIPNMKKKKSRPSAAKLRKREREREKRGQKYLVPYRLLSKKERQAMKKRKAQAEETLERELQALWDAAPDPDEETTLGLQAATPLEGPALPPATTIFENLTLQSRALPTPQPLAVSTTRAVTASPFHEIAETGPQVENKSPFDTFFSNLTLRYIPKPNESQQLREDNDEDEVDQGVL